MLFSIAHEGFYDYFHQDFQKKITPILLKGKQSIVSGKI